MKPVSVLLVSHSYPPVLGGSEVEAQRVASALIRRGHHVTVLAAGGPPMPDVDSWIDPAGVPVRLFGASVQGFLARNVVFAMQVAKYMVRERNSYEIVYFLMQGLHLAAGLPLARIMGKPCVMKIAGSGVIPLMSRSFFGIFELWALRRWAHRVMVLNPGMKQEALDAGFQADQLLWMPNPVDTEEFSPAESAERDQLRRERGIAPTAPVVIYSGRLAPEKCLPSLVRAFRQVADAFPDALLLLLGDGPERPQLEKLAAELGLTPRIRFVGRVPADDVRLWLRLADVYTLISSGEGFACALVEAMSIGLPSVVSDIPANTQLITPEVHGLLSPVNDSAKIAEGLIRLLSDPAARASMGQAARQSVVDHYSTAKIAGMYERLFASALSTPPMSTPGTSAAD